MAYTKQNFEDGQVLNAEHLNKMEEGIADVSNKVANADWEQGFDTNPSYIKNKPFQDAWSPVVLDEVLAFDGGMAPAVFRLRLQVGNTYTIRYGGETYIDVCKEEEGDPFVGSETLLNTGAFGENDAPYCILSMGDISVVAINGLTDPVKMHVLIIEGENTYNRITTEKPDLGIKSGEFFFLTELTTTIETVQKGITIQIETDGETQVLESDSLMVTEDDGFVIVSFNGTILIKIGVASRVYNASAIWFVDGVKVIEFNSPVFAPSRELKKMDAKFLPDNATKFVLVAPGGKKFAITVSDDGILTTAEYTAS